MSYMRVIPRDLFNEGNLLKCYGKLYLELERYAFPDVELRGGDTEEPFEIRQSEADGSLTIDNVSLMVRGERWFLYRPLNSRQDWPLWMFTDEDDIAVFDAGGALSLDMIKFLRGAS